MTKGITPKDQADEIVNNIVYCFRLELEEFVKQHKDFEIIFLSENDDPKVLNVQVIAE